METWPRSIRRPLAGLYAFGVRLRLALYKAQYIKPKQLPAPTISVGNITAGGTGKTPLVEYIARYLRERGYDLCILTRGYGRKLPHSRQLVSDGQILVSEVNIAGDEALLLATHLPGVPVIADPNRVAAGQWAHERFHCQVFVLDDGFQYLQLERDLNLLVIDALDPFGDEEPIPLGRLREPLNEIARADAIVVTRSDHPFDQTDLETRLRSLAGNIPIFYAYHDLTTLINPRSNQSLPPLVIAERPIAAFCGVGNPRVFLDDLRHLGARLVLRHLFPDHHPYSQKELDEVCRLAHQEGAHYLITTEKDWVHLQGLQIPSTPPLLVAHIDPRIINDGEFKSLILRALEI